MTDTTRSPNTDGLVADALAAAVRDYGPSIAADPRRVQAVISDVLGSGVGTQRAELDAVVSAARHEVASLLAERRVEPAAAIARLEATGMAPVFARTAVEIWQAALGTPPIPTPPTMPAPPDAADVTTVPDEVLPADPAIPAEAALLAEPTALPVAPPAEATSLGTSMPPAPAPLLPPPHVPASPTVLTTDGGRPGRRFNPVIGLAGAGVIAVVIALVAVLVTRGGPTDPDPGRDPEVTEAPELAFPATDTAVGTVTRNWTVDDGTFTGKVAVANTTDAPVDGRHIEVIPKSLAADVAQLTFTPDVSEVIEADPIVAWDVVALAPGEKLTFTYTVDVPDDADAGDLEQWKADYETALAEYQAEVGATPPALAVSSPADGATHDGSDVNVVGTTDPGATITVDGVATPVDADGTWLHHKVGLTPGANRITVVATGTNGVTTTLVVNLSYLPPSAPTDTTTTPPVVTPPGGGGGGCGGGGSSVTCWNGTKAANQSACPPDTRVTCWNGTKAANQAACPAQPPTPQPTVTCWNGTTAASQAACPPDTRVTCWNGTVANSQAACPAKPPTPVAVNDSYTWTPIWNNGWYAANLTVLNNDTGGTVVVETISSPNHGTLTWNSGASRYDYQPHHNGYVTDSFQYRLLNQTTGERSGVATVYLTINCNTTYACFTG